MASGTIPVSEALADAGITYRRLTYWTRQGHLRPGGGGGSGRPWEWTAGELEAARRMGILTEAGLTLAKAAEVARMDDWAAQIPSIARHPAGTGLGWQARGLCTQTDPELWFPEKGGSNLPAKRICRKCEVRAECLDYAIEHEDGSGVWGGLNYKERLRVAAARRRGEMAS